MVTMAADLVEASGPGREAKEEARGEVVKEARAGMSVEETERAARAAD